MDIGVAVPPVFQVGRFYQAGNRFVNALRTLDFLLISFDFFDRFRWESLDFCEKLFKDRGRRPEIYDHMFDYILA
jgi:hypothetical protein